MNIFKVIASAPRSRFHENFTSAILVWLLNPDMEHGLGVNFLTKFLNIIEIENAEKIIKNLKKNITNNNDSINIEFYLEHAVEKAIIDIVLIIDDNYYICIENKIYSESAADVEQLKKQIEGIKNEIEIKVNENIIKDPKFKIVFLVPNEKDYSIKKEANGLEIAEPNERKIITWDKISQIIKEIIIEEQSCQISPINEYAKHTIKAFSLFIQEGFTGYHPEKLRKTKTPKDADLGKLTYDEILKNNKVLYIGIQWGENTLSRIPIQELKIYEFWCSSKPTNSQQWITKQRFIDIVKSRFEGQKNE